MIAGILQLLTLLPALLKAVKDLNDADPDWPQTLKKVTHVVDAVKKASSYEERAKALDLLAGTANRMLGDADELGSVAAKAQSLFDKR